MKRFKHMSLFGSAALVLGSAIVLAAAAHPPGPQGSDDPPEADASVPLSIARIYWEYNASANDLGVHVMLDGEDWKRLKITNPDGQVIFDVRGKGPYKDLGMTELFFEGAEPSLDEFPLEDLLALFPEGVYEFEGRTAEGQEIEGEPLFTHAIPDGPDVFSALGPGNFLQISWSAVTSPPLGFPNKPIDIAGYQVIVESFQVTVPDSVFSMTVPAEFVATLAQGMHQFEVLAIDVSGNQTLTEGYFVK